MSATGRVRLPDAPAPGMFQVISLGDVGSTTTTNNNGNQIREYKRRRPHKKTRSGCLGCKQRRVKRECVYESADGTTASASRTDGRQAEGGQNEATSAARANRLTAIRSEARRVPPSPEGGSFSIGPGRAGHNRHHASGNALVPSGTTPLVPPLRLVRVQPFQVTSQELGTPSNELFYHFEVTGKDLFGMPNFMGPILPLALQFPHLRGTALASAAAHLTHKAPGFKAYHIAKHYQQTIALQNYQTALSTPFAVQGQLGVDVLLITAMLMNMLSFVMPLDENEAHIVWDGSMPGPPPPCADPDPDPRRSWVFSPHPNRLGWLALQMGLTPLLIATAPWREKSRLRLLFANSDDEQRTLSGTWQSLRRVPQPWLDLFGLQRDATPRPNFRRGGVTTPASTPTPTPTSSIPQPHNQTGDYAGMDTDGRPHVKTPRSGRSTPGAVGSGPGTPGSTTSTNTTTTTASTTSSGVEDTISEADRLYRAPLRVVAELIHMPPNDRTLLQYFQFIGQLDNGFRQKLLDRDEKALWLFGMWMGLLCRFSNVWWTRRRSRCDFRAIRLWLHLVGVGQRPGVDGQLWRTLLQDLDNTWGYHFDSDPIMRRM
ncbi:hypothetical protein HMPREF1624_02087 [Sporothrix schenckii ATCC 58251]|uniref:Zn(2)-C6 fungal-type domain-containing protein n=1 Tax=Sporothrix schenckii (strain ATCC 58251 / de Perez 2211183) TaxID=1391915 RepID=U7PYX0_SPOS1|nr:hypothetical protein HMPREF1624_02087 [Sporothrix schenckii ATCC 58251]